MTKECFFGPAQAASYDAQWAKLAPMRDGLHFLTGVLLRELPAESRVLCVGAGTGSEILGLARMLPAARFMALEPSAAMMEVCRRNVEQAGLAARCEFHEGYLESLPAAPTYDAATAILVSQFLTIDDQRREFFRAILTRLRPGGCLVDADLAYPENAACRDDLIEAWRNALTFAGHTREQAIAASSRWGQEVAVSKPQEIESLIASSGFERPTLFYQSLFIHAWHAKAPHAAVDAA